MTWSYWDNHPVPTPEQLADPAWHSGEEIVCGWRGKITAYDPARGTKGKRTYRTLDAGSILRLRYAIQGHKLKKVLRTEDPVSRRIWWVMASAIMALVWQENRRMGIPTPPPRRRRPQHIIPTPEPTGISGEIDDDFI